MARDDIGGNRSTDEDQRIRAIATGVVTAAINDIRPILDRRRGGVDEITHDPTTLTHNPDNTPQIRNLQPLPASSTQNTQVADSEDRTPRRTQGDRDYKLNVEMQVFKGTQNVDEFFSWVDEVETGFGVMDCSEDRKLKVVANKLKGSAAAYWKYLKNKRVLDGKPPIATWEKMKSKFMSKFLPPDYEQRLYVQLQNCKQGNRTVEEYIDEFIRLNSRNLLPDNENMQIARFRGEDEEDDQEIEVVDGIEEDGDDDFVGMIARQPCSLQAEKTEDTNWNTMTGNQPPGIEDSREKRLSCIVQRVFLTPKRGPELSTRHQVFRTNALVNEVTAKVVIDTGSFENLVSKDLKVTELNMVSEQEAATSASPIAAMNVSQASLNSTKLLTPLKLELTVKLSHNNYLLWRQQVLAGIKGNRLSCYIDSTVTPPNKLNVDGSVNERFLDWEQQDQILLCWILSSISQEILPELVGCSTSCEAWKTIEKRFTSQSKANVMQLKLQLQTLKKGGSTMSEYIMKKKCVFDALSHTGYGISDEDKIMYVLSGLGPKYHFYAK
ncbi:hypothetical protein LWI29_006567 [Acer saccharum]|uniref:Retrotransposon gag domain-containing protein n=1 Tax=Acer saccharum TaxID=4024 RepID=A0AA39SCL7_ACESA|nr:hypothetical protein LWI29_006567 [Acer saccharum]